MQAVPQLSVIIPHLNEPGELRRCLAALANQEVEKGSVEVIVVDNGSREPPRTVCDGFADVRLEIETVPGPGPARNRGASVARAPLLAFIDADCLADPRWVSAILDFMNRHPEIDFLGGEIGIEPQDPDRLSAVEAYESVFSYQVRRYTEKLGFAATGNMAVRADVFRRVGPFGGIATMEDTEWGQRATAMGFKVAFLPEARVTTPSCKSFAELARRWDRHVAHEFRHVGMKPGRRAVWAAKAAAAVVSPLASVPRILRSDRLQGLAPRWRAFVCLARVRFYRAQLMARLLWRNDAGAMVGLWNREAS
ncbi:glycosyltransferase [Mesorhizobium sp. RP14(2022)]|uniref:Glycosyltransferase n=1 Tax=Mesorhizobium liriopis TaxID=2953882 RepID=A0ABT1C2V0_9HYPH|nr:glycosyltransferase family 2 protein [Mesorhizobium liriopis]MCO6049134.1 glycosyltransferase [Mesorhizobium liriopis]